MTYTHYDLGALAKGKVVEVVLQGNTANVYLMDQENFARYNRGVPFQALGGLMTFSPIRLQTTDFGHWHIVIDLPKGNGKVKTSHQITSTKLPNVSVRPAVFKPTDAQKRAAEEAATKKKEEEEEAAAAAAAAAEMPSKVTCQKCGVSTVLGKFCTECGSPLEKKCPSCNVVNPLTSKFCFECGTKV
ncbi:MAG: DUF1883 domain-containing protein [Defluviitaleaceae bacterium]|nr:DUF1883 domain-containing protein [Defluviitaleaceae bacterium]